MPESTAPASPARWPAWLWLLVGTIIAALLIEQSLGWPITHRVPLAVAPASFKSADSSLLEARLPAKVQASLWSTAFARALQDERDLPRYVSVDRLSALASRDGGYYVKERSFVLRPRAGSASRTPSFAAVIPWVMAPKALAWIVGLFAAWTICMLVTGRLESLSAFGPGMKRPWLALAAAAGVAIVAGVIRIYGFSFPIWDGDTKEYYKPALEWAEGGALTATPDRPFAYPLVAGLVLKLTHDLRSMITLHGVATMITAAILGVLIWIAGDRLFPGSKAAARWAAVGAAAFLAWDEAILQREWYLLPEAWSCIYPGLLLLTVWRLTAKPLTVRRLIGFYGGFCAGQWLLMLTKPNWGLALGLIPLPLVIAAGQASHTRREFFRWIGGGLTLAAGISALALGIEWACTPVTVADSLDMRSRVLVLWHIPLVRPEIERRMHTQPPDPEHAALTELAQLLDEEIEQAKTEGSGAYPSLGYDPDRLLYFGFKKAVVYRSLPPARRSALCRELFLASVRRDPLAYGRKVLRQMENLFLKPYGPAFFYYPRTLDGLERSERFAAEPHTFLPEKMRQEYRGILQQTRARLDQPWPNPRRLGLSVRISIISDWLIAAFPWALGLPITLTALAAGIPRWRRVIPWARLAPVLSAATWATASILLSALTSSLAQALEIQRYIDLLFPLSLFSEVIWPMIGFSILWSLAAAWKAAPDAEAEPNRAQTS